MAVRDERRSLSLEIVREIRRGIPEFGRPLEGKFAATIQLGVDTALREFPELVEGAAGPTPERLHVYRALGRGELAEGRSLDALQAAYRIGGRVAWRRYARVARHTGMRPDDMVTLAEAIFAHIDVMVAASATGYAEAKSGRASWQSRLELRRHLRDLLVSGTPVERLEQAGIAAGWPLPVRLACVALAPAPNPGRRPGGRELPASILADLDRQDPYLILRDPEEDLRGGPLLGLLQQRAAVVGPAVPPAMAADSLRWARAVRSRLPASALVKGPVLCDDSLASLLLLGDEALVALLGERRLRAFAPLTANQRQRLEETLLAWLETNRGSAPQLAARLGIHPQTARQRLHRLQELFGPALSDPDARFELELALRGRRAVSAFTRRL